MKNRLLQAVMMIALIWTAGNATAQEKAKTTPQTPEKNRAADLASKLDLSAKQSASYQKILTEHDSQLDAAEQKYGGSSTKGKQKITDLEAKKETKLKKLLGSEKYATYRQLKDESTNNAPTTGRKTDKTAH